MQVQYAILFSLFATTMEGTSRYPKLIVLSVGAFKPHYSECFMPEFQPNWTRYPRAKYMMPVMPTKGLVNHMSIATGLYAEDHGVIDDCQYDEPAGKCDYGRPDLTKKPIWIENQNRGGLSAVMNWPGAEYTKEQIRYYDDSKYDPTNNPQSQINDRVTKILNWLLKDANLVMAYYGELDRVLHSDIDESQKAQNEMFYAGYFIENLITRIGRCHLESHVNVIVLGSHGGITVNEKGGINLNKILKNVCPFVAMGANAIVTPNDGQLENVYKTLGEHAQTTEGKIKYIVYYQKNIPNNWYLKRSPLFENKIFLVANIGYFFWNDYLTGIKEKRQSNDISKSIENSEPNKVSEPNNVSKQNTKQTNEFAATIDGYWSHNKDERFPYNQTFLTAMGPNFEHGVEVPPFNTTDVYPLLRKLLGLPEEENLSDAVKEFFHPTYLSISTEPPVKERKKSCFFVKAKDFLKNKIFNRNEDPNLD